VVTLKLCKVTQFCDIIMFWRRIKSVLPKRWISPIFFLSIGILLYFDALITNMIMKIRQDNFQDQIFKNNFYLYYCIFMWLQIWSWKLLTKSFLRLNINFYILCDYKRVLDFGSCPLPLCKGAHEFHNYIVANRFRLSTRSDSYPVPPCSWAHNFHNYTVARGFLLSTRSDFFPLRRGDFLNKKHEKMWKKSFFKYLTLILSVIFMIIFIIKASKYSNI